MIAYGSRTWAYGVGRYVLAYGGLLVSGAALGRADAGLFSVALMLGEAIALGAGSVNLAFSRSVSLSETPWAHTWHVAVRVALLAAALSIAMALAAPVLVPPVFGEAFAGSARLFPWLVPGVIALAAEQIVGSYFARIGMSWRIAGLMAAGAVLSAAGWTAAASAGLAQLAWATSLGQVSVTLLLLDQFRRARRQAPAPDAVTVPPTHEALDV
jgi:O-antigen/teichoic acid export membrane protein